MDFNLKMNYSIFAKKDYSQLGHERKLMQSNTTSRAGAVEPGGQKPTQILERQEYSD